VRIAATVDRYPPYGVVNDPLSPDVAADIARAHAEVLAEHV
jgi:hypothetical protein